MSPPLVTLSPFILGPVECAVFPKQFTVGFRLEKSTSKGVLRCAWVANSNVFEFCFPLFMWTREVATRSFLVWRNCLESSV